MNAPRTMPKTPTREPPLGMRGARAAFDFDVFPVPAALLVLLAEAALPAAVVWVADDVEVAPTVLRTVEAVLQLDVGGAAWA